MARRWSKPMTGACLIAAGAPLLLGTTSLSANFDERVLAAQNRERALLSIEPLAWDARLARSAQDWADKLAATGRLEHAPENGDAPEGENIWAGTRDRFSAEAMVGGWIEEKRYFRAGAFPRNSVTGRASDVGHYTQVMWRNTRRVGCAKASGPEDDVLVCRYSAAGNYLGQRPF